jgi:hypothetical protein
VNKVTPKYATIKCSGNLAPCTSTKLAAEKIRIKNELKFLYKKKQHLNKSVFKLHLENAKKWDKLTNYTTINTGLLKKIAS